MLWLAAPLTGLLVQTVIGSMSDRTWGRLGRRRPYFLVARSSAPRRWYHAQRPEPVDRRGAALGPRRLDQREHGAVPRFVADLLPEEQRTRGFGMQSLFIGLARVVWRRRSRGS